MHTVADEYEGKHRIERPMTGSGWMARRHIASAKRGVPNESPRHSASVFSVFRWITVAELRAAQDKDAAS